MGLKPARQEMRKPIWKWPVILGISAALPLICATSYAPHVDKVTFDGEQLYVHMFDSSSINQIDLLVAEPEHDIITGASQLFPFSEIEDIDAYAQYILNNTGHAPLTLVESFEGEALVEASQLPKLDQDHKYYLAAIYQREDYVSVWECVDITRVLLKHRTYKVSRGLSPVEIAGYFQLAFPYVVPFVLIGIIVFFAYVTYRPPTRDKPEDSP